MSSQSQRLSSSRKPSTAKLAYVPVNGKRSKSIGRVILSKMNIFSDVSNNSSPSARRTASPTSSTSTSRRSHDFETSTLESSSSRQSRSSSKVNSRTKQRSRDNIAPKPLPRKTSLARSSVSESESRNLSSLDSRVGRNIHESTSKNSDSWTDRNTSVSSAVQQPFSNNTNNRVKNINNPNSKTTVIVHMSKASPAKRDFPRTSSRISLQDLSSQQSQNVSVSQNNSASRASVHNIDQDFPEFDRRQAEMHRRPSEPSFRMSNNDQWNQLPRQTSAPHWTPQIPRRGQNFNERNVAVDSPLVNMRRERTEFWTPSVQRREFNSRPSSEKLNNWTPGPLENKNSWLTKTAQHRSTEDILSLNQERRFRLDDVNNMRARSTWFIDRGTDNFSKPSMNETQFNNLTPKSSFQQQSDVSNLNSLQVFRQTKYKDRHLAERKIRQQHHLQSHEDCNDLVEILSKEFHPSVYENTNPLDIVHRELQSNIITTSRIPIQTDRIEQKPKFFSITKELPVKEHIYAEIDEKLSPINTPVMHRRVTFSTTHDPLTESDSSLTNKKILPATLWGIVEVRSALREKQDEERRGVARLCYHAVKMAAPDNSLKFLGKVDRNRYGESVYVILENGCFEVRDGEGLIIAKHKARDISVVTEIEGDSNVFVYIGRCKFGGRIGMVLKFNKFRHIGIVIDFFKNG